MCIPLVICLPPFFFASSVLHSPHYRNRQIALAGLVSAVPTFAAGWKIEIKSGSISVYGERGFEIVAMEPGESKTQEINVALRKQEEEGAPL